MTSYLRCFVPCSIWLHTPPGEYFSLPSFVYFFRFSLIWSFFLDFCVLWLSTVDYIVKSLCQFYLCLIWYDWESAQGGLCWKLTRCSMLFLDLTSSLAQCWAWHSFCQKIDCVRSREERSFWNPLQLIWWNQKHCLECLSIALLLYIISSSCLTSLLFTFFFGLLPLYHCFRLLACNTQRSVDGGCWIFSDAFVVVTLSLVLFTFYDGWQTMKWRTAVTHCYMIKTVTSKQVIPTTLEK